jgi:hypothetical protein
MLALLGALEGPDPLLKGLRLLVETLKTQDLRLLLQVEDLPRVMHNSHVLLLLDLLTELFQLILMSLLQLDLDERGLILEIRYDHAVPLVEKLAGLRLVCRLESLHLG